MDTIKTTATVHLTKQVKEQAQAFAREQGYAFSTLVLLALQDYMKRKEDVQTAVKQ